MIIVDDETIGQFRLEVLSRKKNFVREKNYPPKFKRVKVGVNVVPLRIYLNAQKMSGLLPLSP